MTDPERQKEKSRQDDTCRDRERTAESIAARLIDVVTANGLLWRIEQVHNTVLVRVGQKLLAVFTTSSADPIETVLVVFLPIRSWSQHITQKREVFENLLLGASRLVMAYEENAEQTPKPSGFSLKDIVPESESESESGSRSRVKPLVVVELLEAGVMAGNISRLEEAGYVVVVANVPENIRMVSGGGE